MVNPLKVVIIGLTIFIPKGGSSMHITDHPTKTQAPNHLIDEKSPYLLQHAYNPSELVLVV